MEEPTYLEEGKLVVFRRGERFHARYHVGPKQYVWRSLKTSNRDLAINFTDLNTKSNWAIQ